jgi:hypothetical protein
MAVENSKEDCNKVAYATVGELILITNALDYQLATVVIEVLNLGQAVMLMPVVMTLDPARKIEILKMHTTHISQPDWKKGLSGYIKKIERVLRYRNIACHTQPVLKDNKWTLVPFAAAKMLRNIDVKQKTLSSVSMADLRETISTAEDALGAGENLIENFQRVNAELAKRAAEKR